jgi:hypothetical protein
MLQSFDIDQLAKIVEEAGGVPERLNFGGIPHLGAKMATSNTKFLMAPTACDADGVNCKGLSMRGLFSAGPVSPIAVNSFNRMGTVAKAVHEGELVVIYHYMVADYGIPRGNVEAHLRIMENAILNYRGFTNGEGPSPVQSVGLNAVTSHIGGRNRGEGRHPRLISDLIAPSGEYRNN